MLIYLACEKYSDQLKAHDNSFGESYKTLGKSCAEF